MSIFWGENLKRKIAVSSKVLVYHMRGGFHLFTYRHALFTLFFSFAAHMPLSNV